METGVTKHQIISSLISLTVIVGGLYLVFRYFGITEVEAAVERAGLWAPLVLVVAKAATIVIAPLGGSPLYPLAGALFGFWKGTGLLILGDALGGTIAFYLSRIFGRHLVEKLIGGDQQFLGRALRMMGSVKGFFIARVCFMPLPEVVAYGAGLTRINFFPFILIYTPVGAIPAMVLAGVGSVLTMGDWWILPAALFAGALIIPIGFLVFRSVLNEWEKAGE
ncbi:MAG: VTT domain-containing protein [Patescibacteria group bacterium]